MELAQPQLLVGLDSKFYWRYKPLPDWKAEVRKERSRNCDKGSGQVSLVLGIRSTLIALWIHLESLGDLDLEEGICKIQGSIWLKSILTLSSLPNKEISANH